MTTQHVSFLLHSSCYNVTDAHHFMRLVFTNLFWFKCETCNSAKKNVGSNAKHVILLTRMYVNHT